MPVMVRLAWHDAGTYDVKTKTGGANGSIRFGSEMDHGANAGLPWALEQVESVKQKVDDVGWADII